MAHFRLTCVPQKRLCLSSLITGIQLVHTGEAKRDLKQGRRRWQWKRRWKKWTCVLSNLVASIWTPSICQMQATFPGVKFLIILFRFKNRNMFTSSIKRQIRRFHAVVAQWTSKKSTKKRDARAELLFWSLNVLFFLKSSLWSSS